MVNLQCLYDWFKRYSQSFYNDDKNTMRGILLKEKHSVRVAKNAVTLAQSIGFDSNRQIIAETIGLFHDLARYIQWSNFLSFNDAVTNFDHGEIGAEELRKTRILDELFLPPDQDVIFFAIRYHNKMTVPEESLEKLTFAKLIRDADKLDIFRTLPPIQADHNYSPILIDLLTAGQALPYSEVKTPADRRLVRLGWFYDINFKWTLDQLVAEGYLEQLLSSLPEIVPFMEIRGNFKKYIAQRSVV
ncbi:MAG TPA: HD domain-containing protein [Negativicutes bacterium]